MEFTSVPYDASTKAQWEAFVQSNAHAWPGHTTGVIHFEEALGHSSRSHLVLDSQGQVAAVCPFFLVEERRARVIRMRIAATGTSLRGGPLLDAQMSPTSRLQFWRFWIDWVQQLAKAEGIDEIRISLPHVFGDQLNTAIYEYFPGREYGCQEDGRYTIMVRLDAGPQTLFERLQHQARRRIRRAQEQGAEVLPLTDRQQWLDCYPLNVDTFGGDPARALPLEAMACAWDEFVQNGLAHVFAVRFAEKIAAVVMMVGTAHSQYIWFAFSPRPRILSGAEDLLRWHVMQWTQAQGCTFFEIGSLEFEGSDQHGISDFKRRFGGQIRPSMEGVLVTNELKRCALDLAAALARQMNLVTTRIRQQPAAPASDHE